jgi:alpha-ketoglutarate-dependent taurine dioxygenase
MTSSPFDLRNQAAYERWRDAKRASHPRRSQDLVVNVLDPRRLQATELQALLHRCAVANMAIYRSAVLAEDKNISHCLAQQLGLKRLDGNWLADEDGVSQITVAEKVAGQPTLIPYTDRPINWHTDGYYHPQSRHIQAMMLHCVRAASAGGETALMDHEMAYIALRDANPDWVKALMAPDAMIIPERLDDDGVARAEQAGPVFSLNAESATLHMRYTARTRSVLWKDDLPTREAVAFLGELLAGDSPHLFRLRLEPGMGLVCNNVLHDRSAFVDDPAQPRLLYRARYLDRIHAPLNAVADQKPPVLVNKLASKSQQASASSY